MDLATLELIVFCVITFHTGVTSRIIFIDSCKTTLTFTNHDSSLTLAYDGGFLTDSFGQPCEAFVETKHVAYTTVNICVKLNSGYGTCRNFFRFRYAEDLVNHYYYCEKIQYQAVCQKSDALFIEIQPWSKTEYSENITIGVYEEEYGEKSGAIVYTGVIIGCVVIGIVVAVAAARQYFSSRDDRRQTVNQPQPQLTRYNSRDDSQQHQSPDNSAEPPQYTDVMAAENRENNVSITHNREPLENESQNRQCLQEDTLNPSAPPLPGDIVPKEPPPHPDDTIPEEPPPPYPGY